MEDTNTTTVTGSPQLLPWPRARDLQLSICMGWGTWETNMKFKMDTLSETRII